jgi:hypothetical protein
MSANKLSTLRSPAEDGLAADAVAFCAKRKEIRSGMRKRQVGGDHFGGLISAAGRQPLVRTSVMSSRGLVKLVVVATSSAAFVI